MDPQPANEVEADKDETPPGPTRPRSVTILAFGVLIIAVFFGLRVHQAVTQFEFIRQVAPHVSIAYLIASGLVFSLAGLPAAWGLWSGKAWAAKNARRFLSALVVYYWLDLLILVKSETVRANWLFALVVSSVGFAWCFWILGWPKSAAWFDRRNAKSTETASANGEGYDERSDPENPATA